MHAFRISDVEVVINRILRLFAWFGSQARTEKICIANMRHAVLWALRFVLYSIFPCIGLKTNFFPLHWLDLYSIFFSWQRFNNNFFLNKVTRNKFFSVFFLSIHFKYRAFVLHIAMQKWQFIELLRWTAQFIRKFEYWNIARVTDWEKNLCLLSSWLWYHRILTLWPTHTHS